ncbi:ABC transporter ATP-binding protein [Rhizobium sp. PAMB 3182]
MSISNLTIGFGGSESVISEADCIIHDGERLLVCGAAGGGKTTLLSAAAGIMPRLVSAARYSGVVALDGRPLSDMTNGEIFKAIGFVSQNIEDQLWDLSVEDVIAFPMENRGMSPAAIRERLTQLIDRFALTELCGRRVLTLSGGERRMVAIAAAVASQPAVLVLDEPTTGLDPAARQRLTDILAEVSKSVSSLLLSEQDPTSLLPVVDCIALLSDGRLTEPAPAAEMVVRQSDWTRAGLLAPVRERVLRKPACPGRPVLAVSALTTKLSRAKGNPVLDGVDFEVRAGEVTALIGRNGAGKTTLFKSVMGLQKVSSGMIEIEGAPADGWTVAARARKIAYIPQNMRHILFNMSVIGEMIFAITASKAESDDPAVVQKATVGLDRYGIAALAEANPFSLSSRQQALLGLALADVTGAPLAIVDEPILARDLEGRRMLERFIGAMRESGRAVMLISHDLELVDDLADRLMILKDGTITYDGSLEEGWQSAAFATLAWPAPYSPTTVGVP